jgi:hypothetical protein
MLDTLTLADFEALAGQSLPISQGERRGTLEVAEVRPLRNPSPRAAAPFVLTLRDPGAKGALPQGVYRLAHPQHGDLDLFMVPVGPDASGMCYEVVFN